jgi:PhzF family phenazine biosynthesis protein
MQSPRTNSTESQRMTAPPAIQYFVVDAFTDRPFAGNPAVVVPLAKWRGDAWLQNVAMEMNLSETAFLVPNAQGFDLRWFTPKVEVDLCGHATLAAAKVLAHLGQMPGENGIAFSTRSGILRASRAGDRFQLDFPLKPETPAEPPADLIESLAVTPKYVGRNQFDYLVEVESETVLRSMTPDFKRLAKVACRGVIATTQSSDPQFDFVSRFFAPAAGIDEDPVTGSAHCCLVDFWRKRLGKQKFVAYQASARGGVVHVEVQGDRVLLAGDAVIVAQGELMVG